MKNESRLAACLLAEGDVHSFAEHVLESDQYDKRSLMKMVFEMLIGDPKIDDAQRAQLKEIFCEAFPERAAQYTYDPSQAPKWWHKSNQNFIEPTR